MKCSAQTAAELNIIKQQNQQDTFISSIYGFGVLSTTFIALIAPVVIGTFIYFRTGILVLKTPMKGNYLLDSTKLQNYVLLFIMSCFGLYFNAWTSIGVDSLFSWYVQNIIAHFSILKLKLLQLKTKQYTDLKSAVIDCVCYHHNIINMAKMLNTLYQPILFVMLVLNCIQLGFLAYSVSRGVSMANTPFHVIFFLAVAVQLLIYCSGGQLIQDASESVANAVYSVIDWITWPIQIKQLMLLPMLRAQKSCKISAGLFEVNLGLYLSVLQSAASYVTLLRSLDE